MCVFLSHWAYITLLCSVIRESREIGRRDTSPATGYLEVSMTKDIFASCGLWEAGSEMQFGMQETY